MLAKSKLTSILRTLSARELKRFEEYIHSPFFNKNENVLKLYDAVRKHHPDYDPEKLTWEGAFKKVFTKEKPEEQKLRYVMTDLTKLLEDFLTLLEFEKQEVYRKHFLLKTYDRRGLDKYFAVTLESALEGQEKTPYRNVDYYFHQHLAQEDAYLHSLSRESRAANDAIQQAINNLDYYYLSNKLRYCCVMLNLETILQVKYRNLLSEEILAFLRENPLDDIPAIGIYQQILMMYREPEEGAHYEKLKALLDLHVGRFPRAEAKDMYVFALNYCIRKLNGGQLGYLHELFILYKALIEKEIMFEEGRLSPSDYKNIVTTGLRSGQLDWTEEFIHAYKDHLPAEHRQNTFVYNLAFLHYYRKEFSKALKLLQTAEFADVFYQLDAKALLLRTYYELDETEPFLNLADAFINYLKRHKQIGEYQRTVYLNFVKYAKKLMLLRTGGRVSPDALRAELQALKQAASLQWLLEKAAEL